MGKNLTISRDTSREDDVDSTQEANLFGYKVKKDHSLSRKIYKEDDFIRLKVIGKGGFGKVVLVQKKGTKKLYAMKVFHKSTLIKEDCVSDVKMERFLLAGIKQPFLVNLRCAFQTDVKVFLVMDYVNGGNLEFHLGKHKKFNEKRVKLYASQLYLAIQFLHDRQIIHRDLKLSNILVDPEGNTVLTDFGLATFFEKDKVSKKPTLICGTTEYIAPEMLKQMSFRATGYDTGVDWWSFGIILYEMLYGKTPFDDDDEEEIMQNILLYEPHFPVDKTVSEEAKDIIKKLLVKDPKNRLIGRDILKHKWWSDIDFNKVKNKEYEPEFIPIIKTASDIRFFRSNSLERVGLDSPNVVMPEDGRIIKKYEKQFEKFTFTKEPCTPLTPSEDPLELMARRGKKIKKRNLKLNSIGKDTKM